MIGKIYISGEIGVDVTLLDVIKQVKAQPQATEFLVTISSIGGYVSDGDSIFSYLNNLAQPVTTYAVKAYSIASKIFMAGDTRIVEQDATDVIMIHLPWMEVAGDHNTISDHLKGLKSTEDDLVKFYSEALKIDKNAIQSLLQNETYLSSTQAIELGFATQVASIPKAVAKYNNKTKEEQSLMNKALKKIDAIYNKVFGIKNELIWQDATGIDVVFPDLAEGDVPEIDSKANVDGAPANGDYIMPDGSVITVVNGIVTVITPKVEEEEVTEDESLAAEGDEDKDAMIAELQAKIEELEAKLGETDDTDAQDKMLAVLEKSVEKANEMEAKFQALAKQIGSDFNANSEKENATNIKASETKTRAWQILNS